MDGSPPGSSGHGILQARILEWVAVPSSRDLPNPGIELVPPRTIPLGRPSAPAPSIQYRVSNLDWQLISYMIFYMFQCHSPKSSHPLPLPQSPLSCFLNYRKSTESSGEDIPHFYAAKSLQSCSTLCDPIDGSPPGSSVHGIMHARILECIAISYPRRSS